MYHLYGPHGPTLLSNGPTSVEIQGRWIIDVIRKQEREKIKFIDPTDEAGKQWKKRINELSDISLFPKMPTSTYMGGRSESCNVWISEVTGLTCSPRFNSGQGQGAGELRWRRSQLPQGNPGCSAWTKRFQGGQGVRCVDGACSRDDKVENDKITFHPELTIIPANT